MAFDSFRSPKPVQLLGTNDRHDELYEKLKAESLFTLRSESITYFTMKHGRTVVSLNSKNGRTLMGVRGLHSDIPKKVWEEFALYCPSSVVQDTIPYKC